MMRKHGCFALLLLSALLLSGYVLFCGGRTAGSGLPGSRRWKEREGAVYASAALSGFGKQTVSFWLNEEENKYYLFMPSFWQEGDRMKLWNAEHDSIMIDGSLLPGSGRITGLTEGSHTLTVAGESYPLEVMRAADIPALFLDMENEKLEALLQEPYEKQTGADATLVSADGSVETKGKIKSVRVRGNTSADWVKKPYQLTMAQATDFLDMGAAVKWNLLSNWSDKTLLRNKITYDLAARAGLAYSPKSGFVDLYINGEYQGCYQLSEKIEIGAGRVDIRNLEDYTLYEPDEEELDLAARAQTAKEDPARAGIRELSDGRACRGYETQLGTGDITGGYLLEIERPSRIYESASFFITENGQPVTVKRPKYADWSEVEYIADIWQALEDALYAEDGINPETGLRYTDYIDQESFVRKYLVEEIVRNYDASSTSQYFYKDSDETDTKIYAGPVWDYDMSLGNPIMSPLTNQNYISSVSPYGLFAALPMDDFSIWYRLYEKEDFREAVKRTYEAEFLPLLRELENGGTDSAAERLRPSALMDGVRWRRNKGAGQQGRIDEYEDSLEELKAFISTREYYLTGLWVDGRESKRVYLDGGDADMYVSYVEGLVGDALEEPPAPEKEGYTFVRWLNGYTGEPWDFTQPYDGGDLYFKAEYKSDADGSILTAGE